ncbi:hypothetical protein KT71_002514 [Congregibacter litoralis KT71]|uniref:Uncharacterized protein n=1 Tax=Congregibacter litoralis KT71 TaxID=314285 RepID=V7HVR2_9GAMM|nr:hypothetical protein KT71_002514 [Congregibacter litoralis KT71]
MDLALRKDRSDISWIRFTELRAMYLFTLCLSAMSFGDAAKAQANEIEEIVVQATRSGRRVQDQTLRVEVLSQEEVDEKISMRPGNISMMLNETGSTPIPRTVLKRLKTSGLALPLFVSCEDYGIARCSQIYLL